MLGDRLYHLKLGAAVVLLCALGVFGSRAEERGSPSLVWCLARADKCAGRPVWLRSGTVTLVAADGFDVQLGAIRVRVEGRAPAAPGEVVTLTGRLRPDGVLVLASGATAPARWVVALSAALLLALALAFSRQFRLRPRALQLWRGEP